MRRNADMTMTLRHELYHLPKMKVEALAPVLPNRNTDSSAGSLDLRHLARWPPPSALNPVEPVWLYLKYRFVKQNVV